MPTNKKKRVLTEREKWILRWVRKVKVVKEWPDDIEDAEIKNLRKRGYLKTFTGFNGIMSGGGMPFGRHFIEDELSEKGQMALKRVNRERD